MINDIQTLDSISLAAEIPVLFQVVQDLDLMYVGGGSETGMLF